jgi:enoyl-CoA hydratase/carnithine racemase
MDATVGPDDRPLVEWRVDGSVAHVRLARPEKRNALNGRMADELDAAVAELAARDVSVATLSGAGPLFCAGADLGEPIAPGAVPPGERMVRRVLDGPLLWICGLRGGAAGIGVPLALACPVVVAADDAWLWLPELSRVGVLPVAVMRLLEPMVGVRASLGLGVTERRVDAAAALAAGWVSEVVAPDDLDARVAAIAAAVAAAGATAVAAAADRWTSAH